jgi:histidinol-phosphate aminotransferase
MKMEKFILQNIVRANIQSLKPYSCARDEFKGHDAIFLDANENPFGTFNRYPDPYQTTLKQRLCRSVAVGDDMIFVGNGSDEVIDLTFRIFCNPGIDRALSFVPTYGMYKVAAEINDVEMLEIPLRSDDFQIDLPTAKSLFADPRLKIIFICSPNNPTGNLMNADDIRTILESFNGIVFVDEAYIDFAGTPSWISAIDRYPNLVVSQTFSKSRALASARIGLAYSNPDIIGYFNKVKAPYNVSGINQLAAVEAFDDDKEYRRRRSIILAEKQRLHERLSEIALIRRIYPSDANFFLVEVDNADAIYSRLIDMKIVTRNRSSVIRNCIRITVGTPDENTVLLEALSQIDNH